MFERYTEKARRVIFFSRYEASKYGSPEIAPEHLLLGLLREDKKLFEKLLSNWEGAARIEDALRIQQEKNAPKKKISTSVDLPLDNPAKRTLAYAAEEAERLSDRHIGTEHLVLGLLREPTPAAGVLQNNGIDLAITREKLRLDARRSPSTDSTHVRAWQTPTDVQVEFVDVETKVLIALVTAPAVVPTIGEEVVFGAKSFRVVNVSYVYPEATELEGFSKKAPRIRVALKLVTDTALT
jgi:ATP-dependent Clp protease ATP-binding subunit ClpA